MSIITKSKRQSAKIRQGVEKNGELAEGLKAIKNIVDDTSWFRDTPHYWAEAWLPLAYAVACVEVVCKSSEKAGILYYEPDLLEADSYLLTTGRTWGCPLDLDIASISFCVVLAKPL